MGFEGRGQHGPNRTFGLRMGGGSGIDGKPGHVDAHGAAVFGFNDDRLRITSAQVTSRS
jgi:hypothetical protein